MKMRYGSTGRGRFHLVDIETQRSVCGREFEFPIRTTIYSPVVCRRCEAAATPEQIEQADTARREGWAEVHDRLEVGAIRNRRGEFTVHRCTKCGVQHQPPPRGATAWCEGAQHVADLEQITAQGPPHGRDEVPNESALQGRTTS